VHDLSVQGFVTPNDSILIKLHIVSVWLWKCIYICHRFYVGQCSLIWGSEGPCRLGSLHCKQLKGFFWAIYQYNTLILSIF
jgi:hypothetical protein